MSIINLEKVSLTLDKLNIIKDITFSLNKKEVISIVGPSGAGKSSILRIIAGLTKAYWRYVYFSNKLISSNKNIVPTGQEKYSTYVSGRCIISSFNSIKNIAFGIERDSHKEKEKSFTLFKRIWFARKEK